MNKFVLAIIMASSVILAVSMADQDAEKRLLFDSLPNNFQNMLSLGLGDGTDLISAIGERMFTMLADAMKSFKIPCFPKIMQDFSDYFRKRGKKLKIEPTLTD